MPPDSDPARPPEKRESPSTHARGADDEAPLREVVAYGSGAIPNELIGSTFNNLVHPILNMTLGVSPAIVGLLLSFRGIWDAFTDPVMAYVSDNTKKRRGRDHASRNGLDLVVVNPEHPSLAVVDMGIYQFGVSSIFTLIPSLHADVVDFDEYKTGRRREGMLGAAAAYLMKTAQAIGSGISGFVIAWTGFDADLGGDQGADTFLALRMVYIIGASLPLFFVMLILLRYPLTEEKVDHVQAELKKRKQKLELSVAPPDATSE